ncbi:MAG: hypothetical protein WDZ42_02500 [Candidatus Saccharimonadales bacterium]
MSTIKVSQIQHPQTLEPQIVIDGSGSVTIGDITTETLSNTITASTILGILTMWADYHEANKPEMNLGDLTGEGSTGFGDEVHVPDTIISLALGNSTINLGSITEAVG